MLDPTMPQRTELVLALDDRISYLDNALKAIDSRLKVVDAILGGKVQCSVPVSRTILESSRASTIAHIATVLECYRMLKESPSVQASILQSELNLKVS